MPKVKCCGDIRRLSAHKSLNDLGNTGANLMMRLVVLLLMIVGAQAEAQEWPDIRTVPADLTVPEMTTMEPAAGRRVRRVLDAPSSAAEAKSNSVYHSLYLPSDWDRTQHYPIIVELPGNGGYRDVLGDECSGRPEGCSLGYGITGGEKFIWLCLPFLNDSGDDLAIQWWGTSPQYRPDSTIRYLKAAIDDACHNFGGRLDQIVLCGFSRGAIACNAIGLHDDETARLWRAFIVCSHYDGVRSWPFPDSDKASARQRLERLGDRPQFICGERDQVESTRRYLADVFPAPDSSTSDQRLSDPRFTITSTGFRNHNDRWVLRPSEPRTQLKEWLGSVVRE